MVLRSGKYKGKELNIIQQLDPGYIRWISENRPEMLKSRTPKKIEMTDEEMEQVNGYKNLPRLDWNEAFGIN